MNSPPKNSVYKEGVLMTRLFCSVAIVGLGVCSWAWSQAPNLENMDIVTKSIPDGPVARVGDTNIEKIDFLLLYQSELHSYLEENPGKGLTDENRIRIALVSINILLEQEMLYQEAIVHTLRVDGDKAKERADAQFENLQKRFSEQAGRDVSDAEILERLGYRERGDIESEITRLMLIGAMRDKIVAEKAEALSDELVRNNYESNKAKMKQPTRLHLKHISIRAYKEDTASRTAGLAKIKKALDRIYAGQLFEAVVKEYSDMEDYDIGLVPAGVLPEYMVKEAVSMEIGDVSEVIEADTGFHIIQLVAREDSGPIPEDKALEIVRRSMERDRHRLVVREYCDRLMREGAPVRVYLELEENYARIKGGESQESE